MQTKEELEQWYATPDPWLYEVTQDDSFRKNEILNILKGHPQPHLRRFSRALDIGCGEGFITKDIPALEIHGIELSDLASSRLPKNIKRVNSPEGSYDLVMTTGTLYEQYNHEQIAQWIRQSASAYVLIAGIKDWLQPYTFGSKLVSKEFPYRQYIQSVTLYEVGS